MEVTRRVFSGAAIAAAFTPLGKTTPLEPPSPGIKISMQVDEHVTDDDLVWIKQMGLDYLNVQTGKGRATLENFLAIRKRIEVAGTDMRKLMKAVADVDFRGNLIADHVPRMAGARQSAWSYSMGYTRALYNSAWAEKGSH